MSTSRLLQREKFNIQKFCESQHINLTSLLHQSIHNIYGEIIAKRFFSLRYHDDVARPLWWAVCDVRGRTFATIMCKLPSYQLHALLLASNLNGALVHRNNNLSATSLNCIWFSLTMTQFMFMDIYVSQALNNSK